MYEFLVFHQLNVCVKLTIRVKILRNYNTQRINLYLVQE